jgi:hypothetical protein
LIVGSECVKFGVCECFVFGCVEGIGEFVGINHGMSWLVVMKQ